MAEIPGKCEGWCNHGDAMHYLKRKGGRMYCKGCGSAPCYPFKHTNHKSGRMDA